LFVKIVKELLYIVHEADELAQPGTERSKVDRFLKGMFFEELLI